MAEPPPPQQVTYETGRNQDFSLTLHRSDNITQIIKLRNTICTVDLKILLFDVHLVSLLIVVVSNIKQLFFQVKQKSCEFDVTCLVAHVSVQYLCARGHKCEGWGSVL